MLEKADGLNSCASAGEIVKGRGIYENHRFDPQNDAREYISFL